MSEMSDRLSEVVRDAVSSELAQNDAVMTGMIGFVSYMRTTSDGTDRFWSVLTEEETGVDQEIGMARILGEYIDIRVAELFEED